MSATAASRPSWEEPQAEQPASVVAVTFFNDKFAHTKHEEQISLSELAKRIRTTSRRTRDHLPWLKFARFGDRRTHPGKSLRNDDNVLAISGIEADYDGERISFDEAVAKIADAGIHALVHTSPSHTEDAPRWRILCPLSIEYPPNQRDHYMARLSGVFGGVFDPASWAASQAYFFGATNNNPSHRVEIIAGRYIDEAHELDVGAIGKPVRASKGNGQTDPKSVPDQITDKRIRGLIDSILEKAAQVQDGNKHKERLRLGRALGGYLHLTNWSVEQAVEALLTAMPPGPDKESARKTAEDGIRHGTAEPLELEDRPNPNPRARPPPQPAPDPEPEPPIDNELPTITVRAGERHLVADAALEAIHKAGVPFYRRDRDLVRVLRIKLKLSDGGEVFVPATMSVTLPTLIRTMGRTAKWRKSNHKQQEISIDPPTAVAEQILSMVDEWPFPPLRGVIATPTLRHDGSLDNLSSTLMGDFLCQLIERPIVQVRILGRTGLVNVTNSAFVMANGNNLVIGDDTVRRTVQISLDADMENPETRTFKHNPVAEVLADRGRYIAAILTLARAYIAAGKPNRRPPLASFEAWSDLIPSALIWLGWPDPLQSVAKVRSEDPIRAAFLTVVTAWAAELTPKIGYTTAELVRLASESTSDGERVRPALDEALAAVAPAKASHIDPAKLGLWLGANLNRVIAGHKLVVDRETNKAKPRWILVPRD